MECEDHGGGSGDIEYVGRVESATSERQWIGSQT